MRLVLTPLRVQDADEMVELLGDQRLYEFTGGAAPTVQRLRDRYERLVAGSPDSSEAWMNWIVRLWADTHAVGTVQATVTESGTGRLAASIAWVVGAPWQRRGFATEAAVALVAWLDARGIEIIAANIHPDHRASAAVAARAGLTRTDAVHEGEIVWRRTRSG